MRFELKIAAVFAAATMLLLGLTGFVTINLSSRHIVAELADKLKSVSAAAAATVDGDAHEAVADGRNTQDERFVRMRQRLKDLQRVLEPSVENIYTLRKTGRVNEWEFIIDTDDSEEAAALGRTYDVSRFPEMRQAFNGPTADRQVSSDEWGDWLSGYAPIFNAAGQAVGVLGVDAGAELVRDLQRRAALAVLLVLLLGMVVSVPLGFATARLISRPIREIVRAADEVAQGNLECPVQVKGRDEIRRLAAAFNRMLLGLKERDYVKQTFHKYVSREIAEKVLGTPLHDLLSGERRHVTVVFTDLRSFTPLAEGMRAEDVMKFLNDYFSLMIDVLFEFEGTLDKFMGDGLMAVFGAPVAHANDAERAVRAALKMQEQLTQFNQKRGEKGLEAVKMGIGISSGTAVAGTVGSDKRKEYSVIGDTVNVASRLEKLAEAGQVLISESTYQEVRDIVSAERLPSQCLRGKSEPLQVYCVSGMR